MKSRTFSTPVPDTLRPREIDHALKRVLAAPNPFLKAQAYEDLGRLLVRPAQILESSLLIEGSSLIHQTLAVADAWEAICNGMPQAPLFEALEAIPPESPLRPWKEAVLAIYFFYEDLEEASRYHAELLPSTWPVAKIRDALDSLWKGKNERKDAVGKLVQKVLKTDQKILESLQFVLDALDTGLEEAFHGSWETLLRKFPESAGQSLQSLTVWIWGQLAWQDFDDRPFLDATVRAWGEAQAFRLAALGCFGWDPEGALLYWGRFLLTSSREGSLNEPQRTQAFALFWDFVTAVADFQSEQGRVEGWERDWTSLAEVWNEENRRCRWNRPWPLSWNQAIRFEETKNEPARPPQRTKTSRNKDTSQLELFEFESKEGTK